MTILSQQPAGLIVSPTNHQVKFKAPVSTTQKKNIGKPASTLKFNNPRIKLSKTAQVSAYASKNNSNNSSVVRIGHQSSKILPHQSLKQSILS